VKIRTFLLVGAIALIDMVGPSTAQSTQTAEKKSMEFGNFSVSLAVTDIKASLAFYQKLDFKQVGGNLLSCRTETRGLVCFRECSTRTS
jgi:hypothetical protein